MSASDSEQWKAGSDAPQPPDKGQDYPEASFELLITTFSMQAMAAMGILGERAGGQQPPDLGMAKHLIDLLGVIEEKTRGNLTSEEAGTLNQMLHQLRILFVNPDVRKNFSIAGSARQGKSAR